MGYTDATGIYHHQENDTATPGAGFSDLLNKSAESVSNAVPPLVTDALANDAVVQQAVQDAANGLDIVAWQSLGEGEGIASGFVGENDRATELVVNAAGNVPRSVLRRWLPRMGFVDGDSRDAAGGIIGENGRATDLTVDEDGRLTEFGLARIAPRLAPLLPSVGGGGAAAIDGSRLLRGPDGLLVSRADRLACWGDSLTEGFPTPPFAGDQSDSWPGVLAAAWSGVVFNGGEDGQSADEIAIRQGGLVLTVDAVTIPTTGGVTVTEEQVIGWRTDRGFSCAGMLGDVHGTLSRAGSATVTFTRSTDGDAVPIAAGTPFVSDDGVAHADDVQVIFAGRNDINYSSPAGDPVDRVATATIAMMERSGPSHPRRLVIGPTTTTSEVAGTTGHTRVTAIGQALHDRYPAAFYDLRSYLVNEAIYDLGITPTTADQTAMAGDTVPPSIMHDSVHYTPATAALVAQRIREQLDARDWIIS